MGCVLSDNDNGANNAAPPPPAQQTAPKPREPSMDLDAILNMNKVKTDAPLPAGFPPAPEKMDKFPGGDEDAYKAWMRKRMKFEQWENALTLYRMREKDGNRDACQQILERLNDDLGG